MWCLVSLQQQQQQQIVLHNFVNYEILFIYIFCLLITINFIFLSLYDKRYIGYGKTTGEPLVLNANVDKISFTGSSVIGRHIQSISASTNLKRVTLELGGKSPYVVMDDAGKHFFFLKFTLLFFQNFN